MEYKKEKKEDKKGKVLKDEDVSLSLNSKKGILKGLGYEEGRELLSPQKKSVDLSSEISVLSKMAADLRTLDSELKGFNKFKPLSKEKDPLSSISLSFKMPVKKDPLNIASFLEEIAKLCGIMAGSSAAMYAYTKEDLTIEKWLDNIHPLIAPWRSNRNDWATDFFGHPLFGYAMATYFRQQGFGKLLSFVGTIISDLFWEYVCEGVVAPVEWNDLLTTALIGNIAGVLTQSKSVGPIVVQPSPFIIPGTRSLAIGLKVSQKINKDISLSLLVGKSGEGIATGLELTYKKRTSLGVSMEGPMERKGVNITGEKPSKISAGIKIKF